MTWEDIIQKKRAKGINSYAIKLINSVMGDKKPRTIEELLDRMYDEIDHLNENRRHGMSRLSGNMIPTRGELRNYMGNSPEYDNAIFDDITNKKTKYSAATKPYHKRKYWRL
mgnify:CR=1 FL=1